MPTLAKNGGSSAQEPKDEFERFLERAAERRSLGRDSRKGPLAREDGRRRIRHAGKGHEAKRRS